MGATFGFKSWYFSLSNSNSPMLKTQTKVDCLLILFFWRCESKESNWGAKEDLLRKLWLTFKNPLGWGLTRELHHFEPKFSWVLPDTAWSKPSKLTDWKNRQTLLVAHHKNE